VTLRAFVVCRLVLSSPIAITNCGVEGRDLGGVTAEVQGVIDKIRHVRGTVIGTL
jgi:hypothetical protein